MKNNDYLSAENVIIVLIKIAWLSFSSGRTLAQFDLKGGDNRFLHS